MDVAINNKQVAIVRRLEQGAAFAGWLSQKVTKYVSWLQICCLQLTCTCHSTPHYSEDVVFRAQSFVGECFLLCQQLTAENQTSWTVSMQAVSDQAQS